MKGVDTKPSKWSLQNRERCWLNKFPSDYFFLGSNCWSGDNGALLRSVLHEKMGKKFWTRADSSVTQQIFVNHVWP